MWKIMILTIHLFGLFCKAASKAMAANWGPGNVRLGNVQPTNRRILAGNSNFWGPRWSRPSRPGVGAAGVDLGRGPPIRSSSGGPDEAIDTPITLLAALEVQIRCCVTSF